MSEKQQKNTAPVPVNDPLEVRRLIEKVVEIRANAWIQLKGIEKRHQTKILDQLPSKELLLSQPEGLKEEDLGTGEIFLLAFLPGSAVVGLYCKLVAFDEDAKHITVSAPQRVFTIQRRREARLEFPAGYEILIEIPSLEAPGKRIEKRLIDLSGHGLAFRVLSRREATAYATGKVLKGAELQLQGTRVKFDLEIRNQVPLPEGGKLQGIKIGTCFMKISPADSDFITSFVLTRLTYKI